MCPCGSRAGAGRADTRRGGRVRPVKTCALWVRLWPTPSPATGCAGQAEGLGQSKPPAGLAPEASPTGGKEKPHHCRVRAVPVELQSKQVGPNQRLLPSSEGLTAAVEVKAPRFVNLRFKELTHEARTGQGKSEIWFCKEPASAAFRCAAVVGASIAGPSHRSRDLVFAAKIFSIQNAGAGKVNAFTHAAPARRD